MTFAELQREVRANRDAGRVYVEMCARAESGARASSVAASEFVTTLALAPPQRWTEVARARAETIATRALHKDLAYQLPVMSFSFAELLVRQFLGFFETGGTFLTNGEHRDDGALEQWAGLTDGTFDTGIVIVDATSVGLLWVEDED